MDRSLRIPQPRLVLSVGIVGHRENKLFEHDTAPCVDSLRHIYRAIDDALSGIAQDRTASLYSGESPLVRLISGLAIGADRLGVQAAPAQWRLEAILPMPRAEYANDFNDASGNGRPSMLADYEQLLERAFSVTELPQLTDDIRNGEGRASQYALLGEFLVRQVDVLIAIWDGKAAAGPGGTAAVVAQALDIGCMVIWIDPADPGAPRILDGSRAATEPGSFSRSFTPAILTEVLRGMLLPASTDPEDDADDDRPVREDDKLPAYFSAGWPGALHWAVGYSLLRLLGGGRRWKWPVRYASYQELVAGWEPFLQAAPGPRSSSAGDFDRRIREVLLPRSVWADALAWYYGQLYRSAYVTTFILGGLAVPIGLCYLFFSDPSVVLDFKAGFATAELALILIVVFLVSRGGHKRWHKLWLETREISELLRLGRSLAYVGGLRELTQSGPPGQAGANTLPFFYARGTFGELGLPNAVLDSSYLSRVLGATLSAEVQEQRTYHEKNTAELERIDHALHRIGNACFTATIVVTALFLCGWVVDLLAFSGGEAAHGEGHDPGWAEGFHEFLEYFFKPLVSILAAGLPAFGAAFAGIRAQSDFGELARRSEGTLHDLTNVGEEMQVLVSGGAGSIGLPAASEVLLHFVRAMAADLGGWRQLFSQKPLVLPG